jgi:hypothetical protein
MVSVSDKVHAMLPEWEGFAHAVQARRPDAGTWCEAWTVRDVLIHNTGNADEFARVLEAHREGEPVDTRDFEERESPYRAMPDRELWPEFIARCERLADIADAAEHELPPETAITWTGRQVTPAFFAEHMRQEMVLHRWDMTGDDPTAVHSLTQPWITEHSVRDVGTPQVRSPRGRGHHRNRPRRTRPVPLGTAPRGPVTLAQPSRPRRVTPNPNTAQRLLNTIGNITSMFPIPPRTACGG